MWNFDFIGALNFLIINRGAVKELNNRELGPACKSSARLKTRPDTSSAHGCSDWPDLSSSSSFSPNVSDALSPLSPVPE